VGLGAWSEESALRVHSVASHDALSAPLSPAIDVLMNAYGTPGRASENHKVLGWPVSQTRDWLEDAARREPAGRAPYRLWLDGSRRDEVIEKISAGVRRHASCRKKTDRWIAPADIVRHVAQRLQEALPRLVTLDAVDATVVPADNLATLAESLEA
jgi:hypothetical protein